MGMGTIICFVRELPSVNCYDILPALALPFAVLNNTTEAVLTVELATVCFAGGNLHVFITEL